MDIRSHNRGYTLLFAVLTAALVLGVAAFILEISAKQYQLSASARDSMYSYYAADSGVECLAMAGKDLDFYNTGISSGTINCGYSINNIAAPYAWSSDPGYVYDGVNAALAATSTSFSLLLTPITTPAAASVACALITVIEYTDINSNYHDVAVSRGYNHCVANGTATNWIPDTSNPDTVERALQLSHSTGS